MKKIIPLLTVLTLVLCLALTGCSGSSSLPGYYVMESMSDGSTTADAATLLEAGMDGYIVLNEDGTGFTKLGMDLLPLTWEDGGIIVDNKFQAISLEGDVLTVRDDSTAVTFRRSAEQAPATPEQYNHSLNGISGRFDWIAYEQAGHTYKPETLGAGTEGYVEFYGDNTGLFSVKVADMPAANTDPLTISPTGQLVDSTGYVIDYNYDGSTLLLSIDGTNYLYAPAGQ